MASLPFSLQPEGMIEVVGLARVEGAEIVPEIRRLTVTKKVKDERTLRVALSAIDQLKCEKNAELDDMNLSPAEREMLK